MKNKKTAFLIGIISGILLLSTAISAFFFIQNKKKRDDEELEHYLDCTIQ